MIFTLDPDSMIIKPVIPILNLLKYDPANGDSTLLGLAVNFFLNKSNKRIHFWANNTNLNSTASYAMALFTYDINFGYLYYPIGYNWFTYYPVSGGGCVLPNGKILIT